MSTFKITPEDVGRRAVARNGKIYTVRSRNSTLYPYYTDADTLTEFGMVNKSGRHTESDLIKWADETDYRPKDLRDEFAMVALQSMVPSEGYRISHKDTESTVVEMAKLSYLFADAMMKAREGK